MRSSTLLIGGLALVVGCGGSASGPQAPASQAGLVQATATQASQSKTTPAPAVDLGSGGTAVSHVEIQGGPYTGTYDLTSKKVDCNISPSGSGATSDSDKPEGLVGVVFLSAEGGGSPTKFQFFADFGATTLVKPSVGFSQLDPSNPNGRGTAKLDDKGATIMWTVDGTTKDGVRIKGSIKCGPVDRR